MSNPRPSLGCRCSRSMLPTDLSLFWIWIFCAGCPQCHFITSVAIAARIRSLSVHHLKINLVC